MVQRRVSMGASLSPMESESAVGSADLAGIVLAAGAGRRLAPLTDVLTKALCPVGGEPLVDLAIERVVPLVGAVAVNVHHGRERMEPHLRRRADVTVSIEEQALGTAGGVARLRPWLDGRAAVVVNADGWTPASIAALTAGWDGSSVRVMVAGDDELRDDSLVVGCVLPASRLALLDEHPSGLFETTWRPARDEDRLEVVRFDDVFIDCGTAADYLRANLAAVDRAGGSIVADEADVGPDALIERSVVGPGARIEGRVVDSVVWAGQSVAADESLVRVIRAGPSTTVTVDD